MKEIDNIAPFLSRHLDGAVFDNFSRPHLLITDAHNALSVQARRKERDKALLGAFP